MFNLAVSGSRPGGRIDEVLRMEWWLYSGGMGGCVGLWTCMCTLYFYTCMSIV